MVNDNISDMLTRIRNASLAKNITTTTNYSKINLEILEIFLNEGYINNYIYKPETALSSEMITITLKYKGWWVKKPMFSVLKRISKPGKRNFSSHIDFQNKVDELKYGLGIAVISTSYGVISHLKAINYRVGGEILCYIG